IDGLPMRGAFGGVTPGTLVSDELFERARLFDRHQLLECGEPVVVVSVAEVGVTARLRRRDLRSQRLGPFGPAEKTSLMQGESHGKCLRFPRLTKNRSAAILRLAGQGGSRDTHERRSR